MKGKGVKGGWCFRWAHREGTKPSIVLLSCHCC